LVSWIVSQPISQSVSHLVNQSVSRMNAIVKFQASRKLSTTNPPNNIRACYHAQSSGGDGNFSKDETRINFAS